MKADKNASGPDGHSWHENVPLLASVEEGCVKRYEAGYRETRTGSAYVAHLRARPGFSPTNIRNSHLSVLVLGFRSETQRDASVYACSLLRVGFDREFPMDKLQSALHGRHANVILRHS